MLLWFTHIVLTEFHGRSRRVRLSVDRTRQDNVGYAYIVAHVNRIVLIHVCRLGIESSWRLAQDVVGHADVVAHIDNAVSADVT